MFTPTKKVYFVQVFMILATLAFTLDGCVVPPSSCSSAGGSCDFYPCCGGLECSYDGSCCYPLGSHVPTDDSFCCNGHAEGGRCCSSHGDSCAEDFDCCDDSLVCGSRGQCACPADCFWGWSGDATHGRTVWGCVCPDDIAADIPVTPGSTVGSCPAGELRSCGSPDRQALVATRYGAGLLDYCCPDGAPVYHIVVTYEYVDSAGTCGIAHVCTNDVETAETCAEAWVSPMGEWSEYFVRVVENIEEISRDCLPSGK